MVSLYHRRNWWSTFILIFLSFYSLTFCEAKAGNSDLTAYEQLEAFGLPPNLLPKTVISYHLYENGFFELQLEGECYAEIMNGEVPLYYAPVLTGYLTERKLSSLKGISVKPSIYTFLWLRVMTIYVTLAPDNLHIGVGLGLSEAISLADFTEDNPACIPKASRWTTPRFRGSVFWR